MPRVNVIKSTFFRFAMVLLTVFLAAYLSTSFAVLHVFDRTFEARTVKMAEVLADSYTDKYWAGGLEAANHAVNSHLSLTEPEDEQIWLGKLTGERLSGASFDRPLSLKSGDLSGIHIGQDIDDRFVVATREFDGLKLVVALSYEEADEISDFLFNAFGIATAIVAVLALLTGILLANKGQKRLFAISNALRLVSEGKLASRIPISSRGDDIDRLSSDINSALAQLETTIDGIRQVSGDIAHDLRTPLSRLKIHLERAGEKSNSVEELEDGLNKARTEITSIISIFDAILRISQIEAGARKSRFQRVNLWTIAQEIYNAYLPVVEENGQNLSLERLHNEHLIIIGDRDLLVQLMANLVENAMKHTPSGSQIDIHVGADKGNHWASVSDNGKGIPDEDTKLITKRFFRLDKARSKPGSGLGLSLVKAIVDLHKATMRFDQGHPGLIVMLAFPAVKDR